MMAVPALEKTHVALDSRDTPLGSWTVARWSPPPASPLRDRVEQIWYLDSTLRVLGIRFDPAGIYSLLPPRRKNSSM
jgi:hypothetical protein